MGEGNTYRVAGGKQIKVIIRFTSAQPKESIQVIFSIGPFGCNGLRAYQQNLEYCDLRVGAVLDNVEMSICLLSI